MPAKTSAGLVMYRRCNRRLEVLLVHPGGPLFASRDAGAWSIPKGLPEPGEDALAAATREFEEETGIVVPSAQFLDLGEVEQKGGKIVRAWAFEGDADATRCRGNDFRMEWPPRSGQWRTFPEVDRAEWYEVADARAKINPAQAALLDRLEARLATGE